MATNNIPISNDLWTQVVPPAGKGLFSNPLGIRIFVRQAAATPDPSVLTGHPLEPLSSINVDLSAGTDALYARIYTPGDVVPTETVFTGA